MLDHPLTKTFETALTVVDFTVDFVQKSQDAVLIVGHDDQGPCQRYIGPINRDKYPDLHALLDVAVSETTKIIACFQRNTMVACIELLGKDVVEVLVGPSFQSLLCSEQTNRIFRMDSQSLMPYLTDFVQFGHLLPDFFSMVVVGKPTISSAHEHLESIKVLQPFLRKATHTYPIENPFGLITAQRQGRTVIFSQYNEPVAFVAVQDPGNDQLIFPKASLQPLSLQKEGLIGLLRDLGVKSAVAALSGSGDSGDGTFEEYTMLPGHRVPTEEAALVDPGEIRPQVRPIRLTDWIVNICCDIPQMDWYNNDGGFGTVTLLPQENRDGQIVEDMTQNEPEDYDPDEDY